MSKLTALVERSFSNFLIAVILFNAITLGLETTQFGKDNASILHKIDLVVLVIFSLELLLKLIVYRFRFFKSGWNCFDFIIVAISWARRAVHFGTTCLSILRVLRLFSVVPQMRRVIGALGLATRHGLGSWGAGDRVLCFGGTHH